MRRQLVHAAVALAAVATAFVPTGADASAPTCRPGQDNVVPVYTWGLLPAVYVQSGSTIEACVTTTDWQFYTTHAVAISLTPGAFRVTPTGGGAQVQVGGGVCVYSMFTDIRHCVYDPTFATTSGVTPGFDWTYAGANVAPCVNLTSTTSLTGLNVGLLCVNAGGSGNADQTSTSQRAYVSPGLCVSRTLPTFSYTCIRVMASNYSNNSYTVRQYVGVCQTSGYSESCVVEAEVACGTSIGSARSEENVDPLPVSCTRSL